MLAFKKFTTKESMMSSPSSKDSSVKISQNGHSDHQQNNYRDGTDHQDI
jgi:hypothetical protein